MYSNWTIEDTKPSTNRSKITTDRAQQERDRRAVAINLVDVFKKEIMSSFSPLSGSELLSTVFRQRGIPCLDMFTSLVIGKFRSGFGYDDHVDDDVRAYMPLVRWECPKVVGTLWTIEPVIASFIMRGNSTDVQSALDTYHEELVCIDSMSMTTQSTMVKPGGELWGRWAGWILWRAAIDNGGYTDSVCLSCNMSSSLIAFSTQIKDGNLIHFVMTPTTVDLIANYARRMSASLGVTASLRAEDSTKLKIQPHTNTRRATCLRLFGNGSMQINGSPSDIELLTSATFSIVKKALEMEPYQFLSSMRQLKSFAN